MLQTIHSKFISQNTPVVTMSQHCDTSHFKAEVIFSLPSGGKEGRVVSFNPPIEIMTGVNGFLNTLFYYRNLSGNQEYTTLYKFVDGQLFVNQEQYGIPLAGNNYSYILTAYPEDRGNVFYYPTAFYKVYAENDYRPYKKDALFKQELTGSFSWYDANYKGKKELTNAFIVSDTTGTIYAENYPPGMIPEYTVKCIGCPDGEVAISKDGGEDFLCIDKNRVIGEISNLRSKTISIMKYLGL
jgi:hypothetical protein